MRISDWSSDVCSSDLSSDIALIRAGEPLIRSQGLVAGYQVRVPMVDVNAIGAGGGSMAWIDGAGGLRDRKSVVWGKSVSVRVDLGGRRIIKKKKKIYCRYGDIIT